MRKYIWMVSFLLVFACKCDSGEVSSTTEEPKKAVPGQKKVTEEAKAFNERVAKEKRAEGKRKGMTDGRGSKDMESGSTLDGKASDGDAKSGMGKEDYYVDNKAVKKAGNNRPVTTTNQSIPKSCDLLGEAFMTKEFKIKDGIMINDASNAKSPTVKSCFFRWDNGVLPNSGIYLQVMGNPVPDEVDDYASFYIKGKLEGGEMDLSGANYQYKKFDTVGDDGAYSAEQGRYYWRVGKDHVFMLAFNLGLGSKTEYKHAVKVSKEIMQNYNDLQKMKSY